MRIQKIHSNFIMPVKATDKSGAFDIYMPEDGVANGNRKLIGLGFAAAVPEGHVALLLPRSGAGGKHGVELNNTVGVIDSDYRDEWKAYIRTKNGEEFHWVQGDRVLQFLIVPITEVTLELVNELEATTRNGGFGSTGK